MHSTIKISLCLDTEVSLYLVWPSRYFKFASIYHYLVVSHRLSCASSNQRRNRMIGLVPSWIFFGLELCGCIFVQFNEFFQVWLMKSRGRKCRHCSWQQKSGRIWKDCCRTLLMLKKSELRLIAFRICKIVCLTKWTHGAQLRFEPVTFECQSARRALCRDEFFSCVGHLLQGTERIVSYWKLPGNLAREKILLTLRKCQPP